MYDKESHDIRHGWQAEKAAFDLLGYSAPHALADPELTKRVCGVHDGASAYVPNTHKSAPEVQALLQDAALVSVVRHLCGPQINLWRSVIFFKRPGGPEIGWHHDKHFMNGDDPDVCFQETETHFSVLFGLTDITQKTGMIEVVPGSHRDTDLVERDVRPVYQRPQELHIHKAPSEAFLNEVRSVPIPAGSFLVFHSGLMHRSLPSSATEPRLGLAIRLVRRGVDIPASVAEKDDIMPFGDNV